MVNVYFSLAATFVVTTLGSANVPTNGAPKCNNYIAYEDRLAPVGQCYSENNNEWQTDPSNDIRQYFAQNAMFKCEMKPDGTKQACQYLMNVGCTEQIEEESGLCYPCNGVEDQCECQIGGDASECQFYEKTTYHTTDSSMRDLSYCNRDSSTLERWVVNMCIQGSNTGTGSTSNQEYACGGITDQGFHADYAYNNGMARSSADCSDAPSQAPATYRTADAPSLVCVESTCNGVESPRADTKPEEPQGYDYLSGDDSEIQTSEEYQYEEPQNEFEFIFLLDTSSGVTFDSFMDQMNFVDTMKDCFITYMEPKVSVISYGDKVKKLQGFNDESNMNLGVGNDQIVGGNRWTDEALTMALEEFEQYGSDGADKAILLVSNGAPMTNHEPCLDEYVSPTLQKLRDMDVHITSVGINISALDMKYFECMVPDDVTDEDMGDYLTNTDTATALAKKWGYTQCAYGTLEEFEEYGVESPRADTKPEEPQGYDYLSGDDVEIPAPAEFDLIFLLDSSSDVSHDNLLDQIEFVVTLTDCFTTYMEPKVSVMTYGDKVRELSDLSMISEDDMVGGNRLTDEALAMALEGLEENGSDGSQKVVVLVSNGAPMMNHEPCLDDYVSPTLQKLWDMDAQVSIIGINLDTEDMNNLECMVPDDVMDEGVEDYLVNTDTMTNLAQKWGYTDCAYGDDQNE